MTTLSQRAIAIRAVAQKRRRFHVSERLLAALNAELENARVRYPSNKGLLLRTIQQVERYALATGNPAVSNFELWTCGIVLLTLVVRCLEEGDGVHFEGLKSAELEQDLDELDRQTR